MKILRGDRGQTLVETAIVLLILFAVLFAITEFARAWFTKNTLKNAVRQGARVAVVTPTVTDATFNCNVTCPVTGSLAVDRIQNAVCCQPGVRRVATTTGTIDVDSISGPALNGNTVTVTATTQFNFIIGGGILPWAKTMTFTASAAMRYE